MFHIRTVVRHSVVLSHLSYPRHLVLHHLVLFLNPLFCLQNLVVVLGAVVFQKVFKMYLVVVCGHPSTVAYLVVVVVVRIVVSLSCSSPELLEGFHLIGFWKSVAFEFAECLDGHPRRCPFC